MNKLQTFLQEEILKRSYPDKSILDYDFKLSLPRVLQALGDIYFFYNGRIRESLGGAIGEYCSLSYERKKKMERKLINEDMTDATLFDQSEETQEAIAKLLGREDL